MCVNTWLPGWTSPGLPPWPRPPDPTTRGRHSHWPEVRVTRGACTLLEGMPIQRQKCHSRFLIARFRGYEKSRFTPDAPDGALHGRPSSPQAVHAVLVQLGPPTKVDRFQSVLMEHWYRPTVMYARALKVLSLLMAYQAKLCRHFLLTPDPTVFPRKPLAHPQPSQRILHSEAGKTGPRPACWAWPRLPHPADTTHSGCLFLAHEEEENGLPGAEADDSAFSIATGSQSQRAQATPPLPASCISISRLPLALLRRNDQPFHGSRLSSYLHVYKHALETLYLINMSRCSIQVEGRGHRE